MTMDVSYIDDDFLYEGKAKYLFEVEDSREHLVQRFKDDATAFNGKKFAQFQGKGQLNCAFTTHFFDALNDAGIDTHFHGRLNETDMLIERLDIVPLEVVVRNVVAGSLSGRTGLDEGTAMDAPIVETFYKKDDLDDPILCDCHVEMLDLVKPDQLRQLKAAALEVNEVIEPMFADAGMRLIDFKLEFGFNADGTLVLGDEISPDTCRIWDAEDDRHLDKDVFRRDLGDLIETYEEVAERLGVQVEWIED